MNFTQAIVLASFSLLLSVPFSAKAESNPVFKKIAAAELPDIGNEGDLQSFKTALQRQIARCSQQDLKEKFSFGSRVVTRQQWCIQTNQKFLDLAESAKDFAELMRRARDQFEWYQSVGRDGKGDVLFTGYNCPTLQASSVPTPELGVPLYRKPDDLVRVIENGRRVWRKKNPDGTYGVHFTRKEIDLDHALQGRNLELAYTTDFMSVSNLQTEGSGILILQRPDGTKERRFLNYSASNGHPWISYSQILRAEGVSDEFLTIPGIKKYFQLHPEKLIPTVMANPSYVYFEFGNDGPYGSDSVLLSPRHSIAVDLRIFPQGAVSLFRTTRPEMNGDDVVGWKDFTTLAVAQDTGGAIVGPGHIDIYWGDDDYSEQASGLMHQGGNLFLAVVPPEKKH